MVQVNLKDAKTQLEQLIAAAAEGDEVIITSVDGASFRLVPISPVSVTPKFGSAKGLVQVSDDFDEPLDHFEDYAP